MSKVVSKLSWLLDAEWQWILATGADVGFWGPIEGFFRVVEACRIWPNIISEFGGVYLVCLAVQMI
jgi:hypothetical protein